MSFQIQVNGVPYTKWESGSVQRSLDNAAGTFSFTTSTTESGEFPVKAGDFVNIIVGGETKIYGYVDEISQDGGAISRTVTITGRDNVQDLIDSCVPDVAKVVKGPITLSALCKKVISGLGNTSINVLDTSGEPNIFASTELQAAESGDNALEFLQSYARKKQVMLTSTGTGNLNIFRPGTIAATSQLIHKKNNSENNIKSYRVKKSLNKMFYKYTCQSQDSVGSSPNADYSASGMNISGTSIDTSVRNTRFHEIISEEPMTTIECKQRAQEMANIRRARATEYSCVVAGYAQLSGVVWDIGQKVTVIDEFAGIQGQYIIRSVNYTKDLNSGSQTSITVAPTDAYTVQATPTPTQARKSKEPTTLVDTSGKTNQRFNRGL